MRYITGGQPTSREQTRDEIVFLILLPPHAGLSPGFAGCTESGLDGIELIACRVVLFFGPASWRPGRGSARPPLRPGGCTDP